MSDPTFDIFDPTPEPQVRIRNQRELEHDNKLSYQKFKGASTLCADCITQHQSTRGRGINNATYIRRHGGSTLYLCGRHATERRDAEALGKQG